MTDPGAWPRWVVLAAAGCVPVSAQASDVSGVMTIALGIPALAVGCALAAALTMLTPTRRRTLVAGVVLGPIWLVGLSLIPDALSLRRFDDEISGLVMFFGLLALLTVLLAVLLLRPTPPKP